ncbi:MAG: DUF5320 domain-containing protein, partial [Deltaproteobacteria bacterium]|nr:DUF5320 domain-containing protein [Deltaproteobacteria bacterium]
MPNYDQKGPMGQGPRTGRGMGQCQLNLTEGDVPVFGRGYGSGCQRGARGGGGYGRGGNGG